ncbi:hypothetical protein HY969_03880 [Candidatus Kaiserbacteria bacterium]|nr:hypothetical protein [Candidatus Kaiserbacteria bacterium]
MRTGALYAHVRVSILKMGSSFRAITAYSLLAVFLLFSLFLATPYLTGHSGANVANAITSFPFGGRVIKVEPCKTPLNAYLITVGPPRSGQYIVMTPVGTRCYAYGCPGLFGYVLGAASSYGSCAAASGTVQARLIEYRPGVGSSFGANQQTGKQSTATSSPLASGQCKDGKIPFKPGVGTQLKPDIEKSLQGYCSAAGSLDWQVTEGCPSTVGHTNVCHANCTCVDIGFPDRAYTPEKVKAALAAGNNNGAKLVFETNNQALYESLISSGLSTSQVKLYPQVTGSHFSYYCPTCQP